MRTAVCNYETFYQGYGAHAAELPLIILEMSCRNIGSNVLNARMNIGRRVKQMNKGTYAHCVMPVNRVGDLITDFWSDIENVRRATAEDIQSAVLAYLKEIERLREQHGKAVTDAEYWGEAAEAQKENNLSLLDEVKGWKTGYKNMKEHRDVLVAENTKLYGKLQEALSSLEEIGTMCVFEQTRQTLRISAVVGSALQRIQEGKE
ncbi:hypothetical protein [Paenibacillus dendritiformis]|uniref:hypothetical protein n=1 Tax=Paenibacillus dendritiformis TaxID=130049 RepID=UPI00387E13B5